MCAFLYASFARRGGQGLTDTYKRQLDSSANPPSASGSSHMVVFQHDWSNMHRRLPA